MCEFVSWIKKGKEIYFLDDEKLGSIEGDELLKKLKRNHRDLNGHGAINLYYNILTNDNFSDSGSHRECDPPIPNKIPKEITNAILKGKMTKIGMSLDMLNAEGKRMFWNILDCGVDDLLDIDSFYYILKKNIKGINRKQRNKVNEILSEFEMKVKNSSDLLSLKVFWTIFSDKKYRNKAWKNAKIRK